MSVFIAVTLGAGGREQGTAGVGTDICSGAGSHCPQQQGRGKGLAAGRREVPAGLGALGSVQGLLHVASLVHDLALVSLTALPLGGGHRQVAAGHVPVVALSLGQAGLDTTAHGVAVSEPGHLHVVRVEVTEQTHHGGLPCIDLLMGWWEEEDFGCNFRLACEGREWRRVSGAAGTDPPQPALPPRLSFKTLTRLRLGHPCLCTFMCAQGKVSLRVDVSVCYTHPHP